MREYQELAESVREVVRDEAVRVSPPLERYRVASVDPIRFEAFGSDSVLEVGDVDFARGVRSRLQEGDTVFIETDREGDLIVLGSFFGGEGDDGQPGDGGGTPYVHDQPTPSAVWHINHDLGKYPAIQAFDTTGKKKNGVIQHLDLNNATITFNHANAGKATCN